MTPPVIIIGMHRSGTTMVTDLLQNLGLFLGWVLQENAEALFFVDRNEKLMNVSGGDWEHPDPVLSLLGHRAMREQAAEILRRDMESFRFLSYLGRKHASAQGNLSRLTFPWGWKDPRNSFLLPLWLDLFPEARVVHICRHPMDVARSLYLRENRCIERQLARLTGKPWQEPAKANAGVLRKETGLLWLFRRMSAARSRLSGHRRYERLAVPRTSALEEGLALWASYAGKCVEHTNKLGNQAMTLKFEDFLVDPAGNLERLATFCGLKTDSAQIANLCGGIKSERRFAFLKDPEACRVYDSFRHHDLAATLGYDKIRN